MLFLSLDDTQIPYTLVKGKPNRVRIRFESDLLVIETGTGKLQESDDAFICEKKKWILKHYTRQAQAKQALATTQSSLEISVRILGEAIPVRYEWRKQTAYRLNSEGLIIYAPQFENKSILVASALYFYAKRYLVKRTQEIAAHIGFSIAHIRIKNIRSKWGSCSSLKNINLNWRLIFLSPSVVDYVIIHELCHLKHMNHSTDFWNLVSVYCPSYPEEEKKLKEETWVLDLYV